MENNQINEEIKVEENIEEVKKEEVTFEYFRPKFWKRVSAIFLDFFICMLLSVGCFIGCTKIANLVPTYRNTVNNLNELRLESNLYETNHKLNRVQDKVSMYNSQTDRDPSSTKLMLRKSLENFVDFLEKNELEEAKKEFLFHYDEERLDKNLTHNGQPLFVEKTINNEKVIIENDVVVIHSDVYLNKFYKPFFDEYALGIFITRVPGVYEMEKYQGYVLFFGEIPVSVTLGCIIVYYVIPLVFFRGRKTIGRLAFNLGLVDSNVLNVKVGRFTARFAIWFFLEIVLSVFTLCVPLIISVSMMAFSKKKQNFHDYMLGISEVDTEYSKIFLDMEEASGKRKKSKYDISNFKFDKKSK